MPPHEQHRPVVNIVHDRGRRLSANPGVAARVASLAAWAEEGGAEVRVLSVVSGGSRVRRALTVFGRVDDVLPGDADLTVLVALNAPHLVLLGMRAAPRRTVLIDVCDSVLDTLAVAMRARLPLQVAKGLAQILMVAAAGRGRRARLSYIAQKDVDHDRRLGRPGPHVVVAQTAPAVLGTLDAYVGPPERVVVAADYSAHHNLIGMRMLLDAVADGSAPLEVPVELYGPEPPRYDLPDGMRYVGWAPEVADVYRGQTAVFVPNTGAAGLQNKLLEALLAQRPVLAGRAVVDGLVDGVTVTAYASRSDIGSLFRDLQRRVVPQGTRWPALVPPSTPFDQVVPSRGRERRTAGVS